jgi:phosphatidylserine/phosphatidylglycerophosphate/cardiolipin synthase-like enzyme
MPRTRVFLAATEFRKMNLYRTCAVFAVLLTLSPTGVADPAPIIHYAPAENLEHIDVALIDTAEHEIDLAAYVLTDWPVIQALTRAADRGVKVRIYLDAGRLRETEGSKAFQALAETPSVESVSSKKALPSCT